MPPRSPSKQRQPAVQYPPSVERIVAAARPRLGDRDRSAVVAIAREVVADERERIIGGAAARSVVELAGELAARLGGLDSGPQQGPRRVINATGVLIHTNLGRAAWPRAAIEAAEEAAAGQVLLELEPSSGRRGRRFRGAEVHLVALTGAEDALVLNNAAAALALAVGLAGRRGVAVARGELVEIGGGVRIPEIVRRAGARLVEVGTTNRTRVEDFREPLEAGRIGLVLRVHPSNFVQRGFVEVPEMSALAALAHEHGAIVVDDLGSGALIDTAAFGLAHEPTPAERLAAGSDIVLFSGDKLVGGPQAGLLVGRHDLVARLRRDPLARAMRPDKVSLAGVAATLAVYRAGTALRDVPVWNAIAADPQDLERRARAIGEEAGGSRSEDDGRAGRSDGGALRVVATEATVGGGSLPGEVLPSWAVAVRGRSADRLAAALRLGDPPVVGRIEDDELILDLRSVRPEDDVRLTGALAAALGKVEPAR